MILLKAKLSEEDDAEVSIQQIIDFNIVPYLLKHLDNPDYPHLNYVACWCISNICTGSKSHIDSLVNKGLFEILPKLLTNKHERIFEQGAWAVGNISIDNNNYKDLLLKYNVMEPLIVKILSSNDQKIITDTNWALCSLLSGNHTKNKKKTMAVPALFKVIHGQEDTQTLGDSLSALLDITTLDNEVTQLMIDNLIVERLVYLTKYRVKNVLYPLLQLFSYITNGTDSQTQSIVDKGGVQAIFELLKDTSLNAFCHKECLWALSNVMVGTDDQKKYIFSNDEWIHIIFQYCIHENAKVDSVYSRSKKKLSGASATRLRTPKELMSTTFLKEGSSKSCLTIWLQTARIASKKPSLNL